MRFLLDGWQPPLMIPVTTFAGKTVAVFGLGGSGLASARALLAGGAEVIAWDDSAETLTKAADAGITTADLRTIDWSRISALVLAPGVPLTHPAPHWSVGYARANAVEVIGAALRWKAAGAGHRPIAARLDRPATTVRGWLRAFTRNAETVRSVITSVLARLDPLHGPIPPARSVFADAVEAIGTVAAAARRRLGVVGAVSPWQLASAVTNGRLLAAGRTTELINTN